MKGNILLFFFITTTCIFTASSQTIKKLGLEQGLSNNNVNSIVQDRQGLIWIGTSSGLNRFDGNKFRIYKNSPFDPTSINSNELNPIFADKHDDIIWIPTEKNGLNAFNYDNNKFTHYTGDPNNPSGLSGNGITCVTDDKKGNLWIATYQTGINYFNKSTQKFSHFTAENTKGLPNNFFWCVTDDGQGHLYAGQVYSGLSVISIKNHTAINYQHNPNDPNSLPDNAVHCVLVDSKNRVWVGTANGLALFNPTTGKFVVFRKSESNPNSLSDNFIKCITEINDNTLWIGTVAGGVNILNCDEQMFNQPKNVIFKHISQSDSPVGLSNHSVSSIFQDSFGNIWIGTMGGGINFIQNKPDFFNKISYLPTIGNNRSLSNKIVSGICFDNEGKMWVATEGGGIDVFKNNIRIQNYNKTNSIIKDNNVSCEYLDHKKNLWFGFDDGSIVFYNTHSDKFKFITGFPLKNTVIRKIFEDSKQNFWISTDNGLHKYNSVTREKTSYFCQDKGLTDNVIRTVAEDKDGRLWVGTLGGGLDIFSPDFKLLRHYGTNDNLYGINDIYRDSKDRMWIATRTNLVLFKSCKDTVFQSFGLGDGFMDNYFRAVIEGKTSNDIWVSTNNGISHIDLRTHKVRNFNKLDGTSLGDYMDGVVTKTSDGKIYFGTQNGICYFNYKASFPQYKLPDVIISGISIASKKYASTGNMTDLPVKKTEDLLYSQNTFSVTFNIPDFSFNNKVEFSYQMEGLDNSWYNIRNEKQLIFRNLRPGRYTLNLKARLRNLQWSNKITSMTIIIHPPFWLSWWAELIYAIIVILIAVYIIRFFKNKLELENSLYLEKQNHLQEQKLNNERLRFFTNITHELRTPLTLILGPLEDLISKNNLEQQDEKKINSIHRSAKRLLGLINQILEFRKSETRNRNLSVKKGTITTLIEEIGLKYKDLNQNKAIDFDIILQKNLPEMYFDEEVITIILDNLISNAIKYTSKGKITLEVRKQEINSIDYVDISVADTGNGIPQDLLPKIFDRYYQVKNNQHISGTGIGLSLVKNMVDLHEGKIFAESKLNMGSTFTVRFDMNNTYPEAVHAEQIATEIEEKETLIQNDERKVMLVVEDNAEISEYIKDSFVNSFEVMVAENGKTGFDIAIEKIPDIIISDIMMPVMDGIELCKKLKEDVHTSHIPFILLTAKDSDQDKSEGYDVGADSYLTKPFSGNLLRSRVSNILETRKMITQMISSSLIDKDKHTIVNEAINKIDNEFIDKLTQIIEENIQIEQLNIAQIASQMNMSHSSLYRKIKMLTGLSSNEFIRKIRMKNAEELMLTCKYSITEITYKVGISTPAYFRQCFKEEFGMLPSEYLKKIKDKG